MAPTYYTFEARPISVPIASNVTSEELCFGALNITSSSAVPLVLWMISAVLIVPCALFSISLYLLPDTFPIFTASRLPEKLELVYDGQEIKLPPLVPGTPAAQRVKASLRHKVGKAMLAVCIGLCTGQALGITSAQFCSGDSRYHGIWALPWIEWVMISCDLTAIVGWSVWKMGSTWGRIPKTDPDELTHSHDKYVKEMMLRAQREAQQNKRKSHRGPIRTRVACRGATTLPAIPEEDGVLPV